MRKIEQEMVNALLAGKNFAKANIGIQNVNVTSYVSYHNSPIAEYVHETGTLTIIDSGYYTASTKSHQNALLAGLDIPYQIAQIKGDWHITGRDNTKQPFTQRNTFQRPLRLYTQGSKS